MSEVWIGILAGAGIAVFTGLVLLFVEYRTGLFASRKKELSYEILAATPIITASEDLKKSITILFEDSPVSNVTSLAVRIKNTGKVPILARTFEGELTISTDSHILQYGITEQHPPTLKPLIESELMGIKNLDTFNTPIFPKLHMRPLLLNPDDSFTVGLLLSDYKGDLSIEARIAGVKEIKEVTSRADPKRSSLKFLIGLVLFSIFMIFPRKSGQLVKTKYTFSEDTL